MEQNITSRIGNTLNLLLKNPVVLDVETSISNKGNPFDRTNVLVTIQIKQGNAPAEVYTRERFHEVIPILTASSCVIAFNSKFDLNWLQRELGWKATTVWCCQLAEFIFSAQKWKYPSLDQTCVNYGIGHKIDIVKTEYWDKGIDTPDIPFEILEEYGKYDVELTWQVFCKQVERFKTDQASKFLLFRLHCNDLLVLQDMEFNGIMYDVQKSLAKAKELEELIKEVDYKLNVLFDNRPINYASPNHLSCILYGGTITEELRIPIGVYKTGAKTGQPRYKILVKEHVFDRLVEPLRGSELKKDGYFSVEEQTLLSLKVNKYVKKIITLLLRRAKLVKLKSTYLEGLPALNDKMHWTENFLFPIYNQCVAGTGRLSSVKPNGQNLPPEAKTFCVSRY